MDSRTIVTQAMLEGSPSFPEAVKPGSYVEEKIVDYFLGCVPPATHRGNLIQCGEPYSSEWDDGSQKYRPTYFTFVPGGPEKSWKYCGTCFLGSRENRG